MRRGTLFILASLLFLPAPRLFADVIFGSTFTVNGTNTPNTFSSAVLAEPTPQTFDSGLLTVSVTETSLSNGSSWVDVYIQTTNGSAFASNFNATWELGYTGLLLQQAAYISQPFFYFTTNGTPINSGLTNSPGYNSTVITNPMNPAAGEVFGFPNFTHTRAVGSDFYDISSTPYSGFQSVGVNPASLNGIHYVNLLTPTPEPATIILVAVGFLILGVRQAAGYGRMPAKSRFAGSTD